MRPGTAAILRADDPVVSIYSPDGVHRVGSSHRRVILLGVRRAISDPRWRCDYVLISLVPGEHNVANALAALAAGSALASASTA